MELFESPRNKFKRYVKGFLPVLCLAAILMLFYAGIHMAARQTHSDAQANLTQILQQSAVHYYALNGVYPESLSIILEEYHIHYDPSQFVVEYIPSGSNLFPMIDVIALQD